MINTIVHTGYLMILSKSFKIQGPSTINLVVTMMSSWKVPVGSCLTPKVVIGPQLNWPAIFPPGS